MKKFFEGKTLKAFLSMAAIFILVAVMSGCSLKEGGDKLSDRFDYNPEEVTPTDTSEIAVLKGSWYDMGYQLGEQYKDEIMASTAYLVAGQIETWGSYEAAVEAYQPYLEQADKFFTHEKDGGLTDMIEGTAASTGMDYDDVMMLYIDAGSETMPGEKGDSKGEDERDCSAVITWGNATATDEDGCIGAMKADIGYGDLNFMPALLMLPDNGNAFISTHGVFGSAVNEKGLMIESPGGSVVNKDEVYRIGIYPSMYLAAYCDNTKQAIKVLGDPEKTPEDEWWPINTDFNICLGDAKGNACVFEITGTERNIRYNGDDKYVGKTKAGNAMVADETADYLCAANWYMGENMQFTSRLNPEIGLDEMWPDGLVRYWSLEKRLQEAVEAGGNDADSIREAMSSFSYYIKEGWDYDSYPAYDYYGTFVPSDIYEKFESGELSRSDYYGKSYDPENWGDALSMSESRNIEEWSTGWHDNLASDNWTLLLDTAYWASEPNTADDKTGLINIFDSNTKTLYIQKGSSNRALSNIPDSTGTFAAIQFDADGNAEMYGGDKVRAMLQNMYSELELQIWEAAHDISASGLDIDSADGRIRSDYLEEAKELIYEAQSYANLGYIAENENEKLANYADAMSAYVKGQCYAKMAKNDPAALAHDLGKVKPTAK